MHSDWMCGGGVHGVWRAIQRIFGDGVVGGIGVTADGCRISTAPRCVSVVRRRMVDGRLGGVALAPSIIVRTHSLQMQVWFDGFALSFDGTEPMGVLAHIAAVAKGRVPRDVRRKQQMTSKIGLP